MIDIEKIIKKSITYHENQTLDSKKLLKNLATNPKKSLLNLITNYHNLLFPSLKNINFKSLSEQLELSQPKKPIVYISNHVSNLDSLIIGSQLFLNDYPYPIFAAGENLFTNKISSYLLKSCGAFKLKRNIRTSDKEYMNLIGAYLRSNLEEQIPLMIFPEGTRSRDGKIGEFKRGLISLTLNSYFKNKEKKELEDILFVPLGIAYSKVPEDTYFLNNNSKAQRKNLIKDFWEMRKNPEPIYLRMGKAISTKDLFEEYTPTNKELINSISKDFASYLRLKTITVVPILTEDIINHSIMEMQEKEIHLEDLKEKVRDTTNKLRKNFSKNMISNWNSLEETISEMSNKGLIKRTKEKIKVLNKDVIKYYANKITEFYKK